MTPRRKAKPKETTQLSLLQDVVDDEPLKRRAPKRGKLDSKRRVTRLHESSTESFASMSDAQAKLSVLVRRRLGPGAFISGEREVNADVRLYKLGTVAPYLYWNRDQPIMRYMRLDGVHTLQLRRVERNFVVSFPSYVDFADAAGQRGTASFARLELDLLKTIHGQLASVHTVQTALTPISSLLTEVLTSGSVPIKTFVASRRRADQALRYVDFLEGLGLVSKRETMIMPGPRLASYHVGPDEPIHKVEQELMSEVLARGHDYLARYLHLTGIVPFLRVANAYYTPAVQVQERIVVPIEKLNEFHGYIYGKQKNPLQFSNQVRQVTQAGILESVDGGSFVSGNAALVTQYLGSAAAAG